MKQDDNFPMKSRSLLQRGPVWLVLAALGVCCAVLWRATAVSPAQKRVDAGVELMQQREPIAAESEWRAALRLEPGNVQAWQLLSDYYLASQNWPYAAQTLTKVVELAPETPGVQGELAMCTLRMGDMRAAQARAEKALQRNADDLPALKVLADIAGQKEDDAARLTYLNRLAALTPRDPEVLGTLGEFLLLTKDYARAQTVAEQLLVVAPKQFLGYRVRAIARFSQNVDAQTLALSQADFQKTLQLNPGDVEAHRYLGRIAMRLNRPNQAIAHFEAVGRDRPFATAHFTELASAHRKAGHAQVAAKLVQRFSQIEKFNMRVRDLSDRLERKNNKFPNAFELGTLLLKAVKDDGDAYHLLHYRYGEGKIRAVEFYLLQAQRMQPQNVGVKNALRELQTLHDKYLQQGLNALQQRDFQSADEFLAHAILLRPNHERTLQVVNKLIRKTAKVAPPNSKTQPNAMLFNPQSPPRAQATASQ